MFAIAGWSDGDEPHIVFKTSDLAFDILREQTGLRPAPYLAPRGGKWIQMFRARSMADEDLLSYLRKAIGSISLKLTERRGRNWAWMICRPNRFQLDLPSTLRDIDFLAIPFDKVISPPNRRGERICLSLTGEHHNSQSVFPVI